MYTTHNYTDAPIQTGIQAWIYLKQQMDLIQAKVGMYTTHNYTDSPSQTGIQAQGRAVSRQRNVTARGGSPPQSVGLWLVQQAQDSPARWQNPNARAPWIRETMRHEGFVWQILGGTFWAFCARREDTSEDTLSEILAAKNRKQSYVTLYCTKLKVDFLIKLYQSLIVSFCVSFSIQL